jgi:hypothetical protein
MRSDTRGPGTYRHERYFTTRHQGTAINPIVASRGAEVYYFERSGKKLINTKKIEKVYHTGSMVWISGVVFTELV